MPLLTTSVLQKIGQTEFGILDDLVDRSLHINIDVAHGNPNIESISDILESALLTVDRTDPNTKI